MNFGQAISTCFAKYATFSGRASRPEFWWFFLLQLLVSLAASMLGDMASGLKILVSVARFRPSHQHLCAPAPFSGSRVFQQSR